MKFMLILIMSYFLMSCAFISGIKNAKNIPPAPKETTTSQTSTTTSPATPPAEVYNQTTNTHKMTQSLTR